MSSRTVAVIMVVLAALCSDGAGPIYACDVAAAWEGMINAKGGRARLSEVRTLLVVEEQSWTEFFRRRKLDLRAFYILPSYEWHWYDHGSPKMFGITVAATAMDPSVLDQLLALYLYETRWTRPKLIGCVADSAEDMVIVSVEDGAGVQYRYHVNPGTWLVSLIDEIHPKYSNQHHMGGYKPFSGILLPTQRVQIDALDRRLPLKVRFEINPDYDPEFPRSKPTVEAGPEAWRPRSRKR